MVALQPTKGRKGAHQAARLVAGTTGGLFLFLFLVYGVREASWPGTNAFRSALAPEQLGVTRPSLLAGPQRKHGPLGIITQLRNAYKQNGSAVEEFPMEWVAARLRGARQAKPPLRVAHIMLSNHFKLIYVKCTKTAGEAGIR